MIYLDVPTNIRRIEARLRERGIALNEFYREAGISSSTWLRWRSSNLSPRVTTWNRVVEAFERVTG